MRNVILKTVYLKACSKLYEEIIAEGFIIDSSRFCSIDITFTQWTYFVLVLEIVKCTLNRD